MHRSESGGGLLFNLLKHFKSSGMVLSFIVNLD